MHEFGFTVARGPDGHLLHRRPDGQPIPDPDRPLRVATAQLKLDILGDAPQPADPRPPPDT